MLAHVSAKTGESTNQISTFNVPNFEIMGHMTIKYMHQERFDFCACFLMFFGDC